MIRKKSTIFAYAVIIAAIVILIVLGFFHSGSNGYFDFIDNFDKAVYLTTKGKIDGSRQASLGKELDKRLAERCSSVLPDKLRASISNHLSYDSVQLVRKSATVNSGTDFGRGSFLMSLVFSPADLSNDAIPKDPLYSISINYSGGKAVYAIIIYGGNPTKIEIVSRRGNEETVHDSFHIQNPADMVRLYVLTLGNRIILSSGYSLLSHILIDNTVEPGKVSFKQLRQNGKTEMKSVRIKRLGSAAKDDINHWIYKYKLVPEKNTEKQTEKNFVLWNELEYEDRLGGVETGDVHLRRLKLNNETRRAVVSESGDSFTFRDIRIRKDTVLEFAAAAHPDSFAGRRDLAFVVDFSKNGRLLGRCMKKIDTKSANLYRWQNVKFDLSRFAGKKTDITFKIITGSKFATAKPGLIAWGDPVIRQSAEKDYKNIVLISFDTLSADHIGCYGYERDTTPEIDKWSKGATFFANSISNSSWTLSSHVSMLTSQYPGEAGIDVCANTAHINRSRLAPGIPSLASYLRMAGYYTYAITGGGYMSAIFGFDRGFNVYKECPERKDFRRDVFDALRVIRENRDRRFFLFLHTFEIHAAYRRKFFVSDRPEKKFRVIADYDSGILYADRFFGLLIREMKKLGIYDKTLIIVTSDHGEHFDHITEKNNFGSHGDSLKESLIRVPLIIGGLEEFETGKTVRTIVSGVDIVPTVLDAVGIDYKPEAMRGISLLTLPDDEDAIGRKVYSSNILGGVKDMDSLRSIGNKLVRHRDVASGNDIPSETEFYDISKDPDEKVNIAFHQMKKMFEREIIALNKQIAARRAMLKKFSSSRGRYRDLWNALNIGGYVSPIDY